MQLAIVGMPRAGRHKVGIHTRALCDALLHLVLQGLRQGVGGLSKRESSSSSSRQRQKKAAVQGPCLRASGP